MTQSRAASAVYPAGLRAVADRNGRLRGRLAEPRILIAPGAYDCITARLVETAGFEAVYITGAGVSLSQLGAPDLGLLSFAEVLDRMKRIADAVTIPAIADIDTGFGGPLNVIRTVRELERAGVSAVQIEDQEAPKRCGHEIGRRIVGAEEMIGRIKAAVDARVDPDLAIIARTDARTAHGFAAAIDRMERYAEAGADLLFLESPETEGEMRELCSRLASRAPLVANMVEGGRTPSVPAGRLAELGYRLVIYPNALTRAFARVGQDLLAELARTGTTAGFASRMLGHDELWQLFDYSAWLALESDFARKA